MSEERLRILKMLEEGKIGADEANKLLETMDVGDEKKGIRIKEKPRFIKILVEEEGKEKVNISVPFSLAKTALKFMPKSARKSLNEQEIDLDQILNSVKGDLGDGTLVNIDDEENHIVIKFE